MIFMDIPILPMLLAAIATFVAIFLLRPFAISIGLVDKPNIRKLHKGSVPLIGGIAMFIGVVVSILASSYDLNQFNYFLLASLVIVMVGVLDDHQNISVSLRLLFQLLVAIIVVTVGEMNLESLGNLFGYGDIILDEWSYLISVIAIIAGMNAVNMADGMHGLAGGNSLITFLALLYLSIDNVSREIVLISSLFCSVLSIFLINNLCLGVSKSKRIFMGDAGSMFIGLAIAWILLDLSQGESRSFAPVTALWLFALPIIEMTTAIVRRISSGKSPFKPDLYHFHHLLIRVGFKEKTILLLILVLSSMLAIIGILGEESGVAEWVMFVSFLVFFGCYVFLYALVLKNIKSNGK
jgi:UDP-GlcNAc:undecaprenyl-phosphate/decaprenyl-phosphate GlcNAc-1-phosphate transferase